MAPPNTPNHPEILLGAGPFGGPKIPDADSVRPYIDLFRHHGHKTIDTARGYPLEQPRRSEEVLGELSLDSWAVIDTKIFSFGEKAHSKENVGKNVEGSLKALGFDPRGGEGQAKVDVMYLHAPTFDVEDEETLGAVNEAFQKGQFRKFGLSNYSPARVENFVAIAEKNGWVKPTVYQGQYNPIARLAEKDLLPVLRKHGIAFRAYSPSGGGIFSGKVSMNSIDAPDGRFSHNTPVGKFMSTAYLRDELLAASREVQSAAKKHGISGQAVALRWVLHHSALRAELGDGLIVGFSSLEQLGENLKLLDQGPLPQELVEVVDGVWGAAEPVAPWAYIDAPIDILNKD
ncbi:hypothetical protein LTR97_009984 [Elasticomyces elasticus]|uniref:NADP-dependent oxidoreductase domain-containing protein n=1 Tax=Elasticomyces elasticus TaxID=574655 RepID=A0AAN7VMF8_9PEZI|nr:hypothetical protein LTR97_009984 [Elasticomyces elasticus]